MPDETKGQPGRTHRELEAALHRLGERVDVPPRPAYATLVKARLAAADAPSSARAQSRKPRHARAIAVAVALVVAVAVILGIPQSRKAVADLFGISGVSVHPLSDAPPNPRATLDQRLDLGEPVTLADAQGRVGFTVALPAAPIGAPDAIYMRREPGLQAVNLVYRPAPGLPRTPGTHVGLLLSEYAGSASPYFDKYVDMGVPVSQVTLAGRWPGLYFPGPQEVLVRDAGARVHSEHARLSGPSLIWVQGSVTYRLEGDISRARALAIAASLR